MSAPPPTCGRHGCNVTVRPGDAYCIDHTCPLLGCTHSKATRSDAYCHRHTNPNQVPYALRVSRPEGCIPCRVLDHVPCPCRCHDDPNGTTECYRTIIHR